MLLVEMFCGEKLLLKDRSIDLMQVIQHTDWITHNLFNVFFPAIHAIVCLQSAD